jgi:hypothetical protein
MRLEEGAATPFAGGIMQHGYQCGMIWGATLAAGAEAYRRFGSGPEAETGAIRAAGRIVETFRTRHDEINCLEITDIDKDSSVWEMINFFLIKGGTVECFRMASWFAPLAFDAIDSELNAAESEEGEEVSRLPVSCAAVLAKKLGVLERQAVMAAGLAGGIGLCGGACGALGAAIWILGMEIAEKEGKKIGYKDSRTQDVIERFLKETEFKFECSEIVGRKFEDVDDHAAYLEGGGCSELIEVLAAG